MENNLNIEIILEAKQQLDRIRLLAQGFLAGISKPSDMRTDKDFVGHMTPDGEDANNFIGNINSLLLNDFERELILPDLDELCEQCPSVKLADALFKLFKKIDPFSFDSDYPYGVWHDTEYHRQLIVIDDAIDYAWKGSKSLKYVKEVVQSFLDEGIECEQCKEILDTIERIEKIHNA